MISKRHSREEKESSPPKNLKMEKNEEKNDKIKKNNEFEKNHEINENLDENNNKINENIEVNKNNNEINENIEVDENNNEIHEEVELNTNNKINENTNSKSKEEKNELVEKSEEEESEEEESEEEETEDQIKEREKINLELKLLKNEFERKYNSFVYVGEVEKIKKSFKFELNEKDCVNLDFSNVNALKENVFELPWKNSSFGYGKERVYNPNVRLSKELCLERDFYKTPTEIRELGEKILKKEVLLDNFYVVPYKIILYEEKSFFEEHTDTLEPNLKYSLVVVFPTEHTGGDLMFGDFNSTSKFIDSTKINYIFFDPKMPHSVSPVLSGFRLCVTFKIFELKTDFTVRSKKNDFYDFKFPLPLDYFSKVNSPKNVLISHPNVDHVETLLSNLNVKTKIVYSNDEKPEVVYDTYSYQSDSSNIYEAEYCFDDSEEEYKIKHFMKIGSNTDEEEVKCCRVYGYTGNSPCRSDYELKFHKFLLINPVSN